MGCGEGEVQEERLSGTGGRGFFVDFRDCGPGQFREDLHGTESGCGGTFAGHPLSG